MQSSGLARVLLVVWFFRTIAADDGIARLQRFRFNISKEDIFHDTRVIPVDHQVSAFLPKEDTKMFFFLHEKNETPLSVTITPCTSIIAWNIRHLHHNDTGKLIDIAASVDEPLLEEFRGNDMHTWSVQAAQGGMYVLQVSALERETYVYLYVSVELGGPHPPTLTQKPRIRILQRQRRKRLTVRWEPSSVDPHMMHYCLVVNTRRYYSTLCEAEGERDGVTPPETSPGLRLSFFRKQIEAQKTRASQVHRLAREIKHPTHADIVIGCVGRKTSYTVSHLKQGNVYHFNLFAVNRRTNLSFPYAKTTLKYEPRNKPFGLKDGKAIHVNLRKFDGRATFKFKVGKKTSGDFSMYIMACGGGEVEVEILLRNKAVITRHHVIGYERLNISEPVRGQRYVIRVLALNPEELRRIASIEVMATTCDEKRFPFPQLPASGALVHEYDSLRRCDTVTVGWVPSPDPDASQYCVYLHESPSMSETLDRYPDQCALEFHLTSKSDTAMTHCQEIFPDDHRSVITQTIANLTQGRNYIVQVTVSKVLGKTLSYNLLQVHTKPVCT